MTSIRPAIGTKKISAEGGGQAQWDGQPQRPPKEGELFISGALPVAYLASHDMTVPYFIAQRTNKDLTEDIRTFSVVGEVRGNTPPRELLLRIPELANAPATSPFQMAQRANEIMQLAADVIITAAATSALNPETPTEQPASASAPSPF